MMNPKHGIQIQVLQTAYLGMLLGYSLFAAVGCSSSGSHPDNAYQDFLDQHKEKGWVEITPEVVERLQAAYQKKRERQAQNNDTWGQETTHPPLSTDASLGDEWTEGSRTQARQPKKEDAQSESSESSVDPESNTLAAIPPAPDAGSNELAAPRGTPNPMKPGPSENEAGAQTSVSDSQTSDSSDTNLGQTTDKASVPAGARIAAPQDAGIHSQSDSEEPSETTQVATQEEQKQGPSPKPPSDELNLVPENTRSSEQARSNRRSSNPRKQRTTRDEVIENSRAGSEEATDGHFRRTNGPEGMSETNSGKESLELRNIALTDMVRLVARQVGMDIIVPDSLDQRVTLSLKDTEPLVALKSVLATNGYEIAEESPGLFLVRKVKERAITHVTRAFTLTSLPVEKVEADLKSILSPEGKIVLNQKANSFLVLDRPENVDVMEDFVRLLDIRERQVLVEATIMEIRLENNDQIGMLLEFLDINLDDVTGSYGQDLLPTDSAFTINLLGDNEPFQGAFEAIMTMEALNILSTPKVATLNGETAVIEIIERIPYIDSTATTTTQSSGLGNTTVQQVEFEEIGVTLTIRPTIGDDDIIKLKITPEVKELRSFFQGIPVTERRKVDTTVLVKNGGSIVIGGLLRENEFETERKVPLLGDIPLIGAAFRSRQRRLEKNELLILISPRIIDTEEEAVIENSRESVEETRKKHKRQSIPRAGRLIW